MAIAADNVARLQRHDIDLFRYVGQWDTPGNILHADRRAGQMNNILETLVRPNYQFQRI